MFLHELLKFFLFIPQQMLQAQTEGVSPFSSLKILFAVEKQLWDIAI